MCYHKKISPNFLLGTFSLKIRLISLIALTLWHPGSFVDFREKKRLNAHDLVREFLWSGMLYRPGKSLKRLSKSSSLHSKNKFLLGRGFFMSDVISGGLFGPLCLALGTNC